MSFPVTWHRQGLSELADIWLARPDERDQINRAAEDIDRYLSVNPQQRGESRENNRRVLFVEPLVVSYSVDEEHQVVRVLGIRGMRRRRS